MRVLLLTQVVPNPPDAGPKIKTHFALRMLAREHRVELLTFVRDEREERAAEALRDWCDRVTMVPLVRSRPREPFYLARGWASGTPFLVARDYRPAFARQLRDRLAAGGVDVVHADQLSMAQYLPLARQAGARTVFDAHNAVFDLVRDLSGRQPTPVHRAATAIEWRLLRRFEGRLCRESDLTLAVSREDEQLLGDAAGGPIHSVVVPIGVEVEEVTPVPASHDATRLLSVATMHYPPNAAALRWFRDDVWPLLRDGHPSIGLDVVGPRPPDDLARWGQSDGRVRVPGYVPEIEPFYRDAAIFIVPLRAGSGVRVKILEAMARGVPVVSTSIGAASLDLRHGEHLLIADTPAEFAQAVLDLLRDPARRVALAAAARERVCSLYDWRRCNLPILAAYRTLAEQPVRADEAESERRDLTAPHRSL